MSRSRSTSIKVAGLVPRLLAALLDALLPILVGLGIALFAWPLDTTAAVVAGIVGAVALGAYAIVQWWAYAVRGAGIGFRIMSLRLAGVKDGKPIGWWRMFIRFIVKAGLWATVIGGILLVIFLVIHERRQGWHDLAARSIVVEYQQPERSRVSGPASHTTSRQANATVGLPPHLQSGFSPDGARAARAQADQFAPRGSAPSPQPAAGVPAQPWVQVQQGQTAAPQQRPAQYPAQATGWAGAESATPISGGAPIASVPGFAPRPPAAPAANQQTREVKVKAWEASAEEHADHTRLVANPTTTGSRPADQGWYLRLDDGREVDITQLVLVGRSPAARLDEPDSELVRAEGDSRMVSKTHLALGVDARGAYVIDRGSTNGTAIVNAQGQLDPCASGVQVRVREGQVVSFGNRWLTVLRRSALG